MQICLYMQILKSEASNLIAQLTRETKLDIPS